MQKSNIEGLLNSIKSKFTFKYKLLHIFFFPILLLILLCWVAKKCYTQQLQVQNTLTNHSLFFPNSRLSTNVITLWSVHLKVSLWPTYTSQTIYCGDGCVLPCGMSKYVPGGSKWAWETCGFPNGYNRHYTLRQQQAPCVLILYSLYIPYSL